MGAHEGLHEPAEALRAETLEQHRALISLIEELEAIDWYAQRVDASTDLALAAVLAHNRDEEREHAAMTLEWLRRNDPQWDAVLRRYLFTDDPILEVEEATEAATQDAFGVLNLSNLGEEQRR
jgi:ferritin-like protein